MRRERLPSPGASAVRAARPGAETPELPLDLGQEVQVDRVPVGPEVLGVHRVRVVEVRVRVLDLNEEDPRELRRRPELVEPPAGFLDDALVSVLLAEVVVPVRTVAGDPGGVGGGERRVGGGPAPAPPLPPQVAGGGAPRGAPAG